MRDYSKIESDEKFLRPTPVGGECNESASGSYLKDQLTYRPGIYCIGAAPGFVTGDQVSIPMWADRFFLGWIFRIVTEPRRYFARYCRAIVLPRFIIKYGREMPPFIGSSAQRS